MNWLRAVDEAMVVTHLGVANEDDSYEIAKHKLNNLIGWHVDVATDPAVNGGFKLAPEDQTEILINTAKDYIKYVLDLEHANECEKAMRGVLNDERI